MENQISELLNNLECATLEEAFLKYLRNPDPTITESSWISELLQTMPSFDLNIRSSIICPLTNVYVATKCGLEGCRYHINNVSTANCLLIYMDRQKGEEINLCTQQLFYGTPRSKLMHLLNSATIKVRSTYFRDWAYIERVPIHDIFETTKVCVVCESVILEPPFCTKYNQVWCSQDCFERLPPYKIRLEKSFGLCFDQLKFYLSRCFEESIVRDIFSKCTY